MVESTGLENRRAFTGPAGSNPAPSAKEPETASVRRPFDESVPIIHSSSNWRSPSEMLGLLGRGFRTSDRSQDLSVAPFLV